MKRTLPIEAVVFDLDGTLLDSLPLVLRAFQHALEPFGGRPTMETFAMLGGPPEKIFAGLIADPRDVPAALRRLHDYHGWHPELIQPFDGAISLLQNLQARRIKLGVWTGRDRSSAASLLQLHDMEKFFSAIVCGDDLSSHKPDPAGLNQILLTLQVDAACTLFIGDADVDVIGGSLLSVDTLIITHARALDAEIRRQAADVVRAPADAYAWVMDRAMGSSAEV